MDQESSFKEREPETIIKIPLLGVLSPMQLDPYSLLNYHSNFISNTPVHTSTYEYNKYLCQNMQDPLLKDHLLITNCNNHWENTLNPLINFGLPFNNSLLSQISLSLPYNKNSASWCVAISLNNKYLAWNAGNNKVYIIPIKNIQNSLEDKATIKNNQITTVFDCGDIISSMSFGSGKYTRSKHFQMSQDYAHIFGNKSKKLSLKASKWSKYDSKVDVQSRFDFSKEDCILATGLAHGQIKVWHVPSGRLMLILYDHKSTVNSLVFCPNPSSLILLSGSSDRTMKVWNLKQDGNMTPTIDVSPYQTRVLAISWSPNSERIVSVGGSNKIYIWNSLYAEREYSMIKSLSGHLNEIVDCDHSSDGALLITASLDSYVILWDPYTFQALRKFGHKFPPPRPIFASGPNSHGVRGVQFISDNHLFCSVADDGYLRLWDPHSDLELPIKIGRQDFPLCCKYSANPSILATGDKFGRLMLWGMCDSHIHYGDICKNIICEHSDPSMPSSRHFDQPNRLEHLCRLALRILVPDTTKLDSHFSKILPRGLISYIKYCDVKSQNQVLSSNYPYIIYH